MCLPGSSVRLGTASVVEEDPATMLSGTGPGGKPVGLILVLLELVVVSTIVELRLPSVFNPFRGSLDVSVDDGEAD